MAQCTKCGASTVSIRSSFGVIECDPVKVLIDVHPDDLVGCVDGFVTTGQKISGKIVLEPSAHTVKAFIRHMCPEVHRGS